MIVCSGVRTVEKIFSEQVTRCDSQVKVVLQLLHESSLFSPVPKFSSSENQSDHTDTDLYVRQDGTSLK